MANVSLVAALLRLLDGRSLDSAPAFGLSSRETSLLMKSSPVYVWLSGTKYHQGRAVQIAEFSAVIINISQLH